VVRRRGTAGQSNDVEDDEDSRLHDSLEDERLQKEAVADMFNMSETLKANALAISAALETDDKVRRSCHISVLPFMFESRHQHYGPPF